MIPAVAELVAEYDEGVWSKGDFFQRASDLVSRYPVQAVVDAMPDEHREEFVTWMRETYDNDVSADDYIMIGRDDREELRQRLPILRAWFRQTAQ